MRSNSETRKARVAALSALALASYDEPHAEALGEAADTIHAVAGTSDPDETARLWRAYGEALGATSQLVRWLQATRTAEVDGDRFLRATRQRAEESGERLDVGDPTHSALIVALQSIIAASDPASVARAIASLRAVALPLPLIAPASDRQRTPLGTREEERAADPVGACMMFVRDAPAIDVVLVEPNIAYPLRLRISATEWPQWASTLEVDFLSALREHASFPRLTLARPDQDQSGLWTAEAEGLFTVTVTQLLGAPPISCVVSARLVGDGKVAELPITGVGELQVRTFDPTRDNLGGPHTYALVDRMLAELHHSEIPQHESASFARFFSGTVRAAAQMFIQRAYPAGQDVTEATFQRDLLGRLSMIDELAGRVVEGAEVGGGETDLSFEGIVSELKVERTTTPTVQTAARYLGQPVTYASAGGRRLSILCILDLITKDEPPAVLANYVGWLDPAAHGLEDPAFPSRVGVVIIPGNLPLPSDWAGRRMSVRDTPRVVQ